MSRIAVIAALPGELAPLVRGWRRASRRGVRLWTGTLGPSLVTAACAGMGPAAVRRAFAEIERDGGVDRAISAGWAGSLGKAFAPGEAYAVAGVIDAATGERFAAAGGAPGCWLVTAAAVAGPAEKAALASAFGAGLVDLEAAEVARLAAARGIAFACVKAVSDGPAEPLPDFGAFVDADGRFRQGRFAVHALLRPRLWGRLIRLGSTSTRAAARLAVVLRDVLESRPSPGR